MYTDFTIKNFRVFDQNGTIVPLHPITILTGCNNVGKSSIVKALCLLKDFCQQIETDYEEGKKLHLERYTMDFHKAPNDLMYGFDHVLHHATKAEVDKKNSMKTEEPTESIEDNFIVFEVIVGSSWLLQDVILHLEFGSLDWDDLNNGYLQAYAIKTLDGRIIYKAERDGKASMDFSIVKKSFLHFLYGQYAISKWQNAYNLQGLTGSDVDEEGKLFEESIKNITDDLGPTASVILLEWQTSHCHHTWQDGLWGPCESLLQKVPDPSFVICSPKFGVFCFFPCLQVLKDFQKKDIRQEINKRLESSDKSLSSRDREIINLFLDSFEASDVESLHEYISKREDDRYFVCSSVSCYQNMRFAFPNSMYWEWPSDPIVETLPEDANWSVIMYSMDLINKLMTNTTQSLLDYDEIDMSTNYVLEYFINVYLRNTIEDVFFNLMPGSLAYSPTTIVQPKRLYTIEENNDFARTLKRYHDAKRMYEEEKKSDAYSRVDSHINDEKRYKPCLFIDKWLKQLGIADHVKIESHVDGYGVTIHLFEDDKDSVGMHLVDKGFGILQLFAVLLKIEIAILETKTNEDLYEYCTTGLNNEIVKFLRTHNQLHPATVALEEPECHLHPSLQSKFADIIVDAYTQYGIHFLVESHSEYFIRKLQLLVSQKEIDCKDISLLYVNPISRPSYLPFITDIGLEMDGTLKNEFGTGFFDESLRLSKELFKPVIEDDEEKA